MFTGNREQLLPEENSNVPENQLELRKTNPDLESTRQKKSCLVEELQRNFSFSD